MRYQYQPTCQVSPETLDRIYCDAFGFKKDGTFVEVGAHDGWHWSNTWGLAAIGWHGIYIEPCEELFAQCVQTHIGHPNTEIANCCIGEYNGVAKLGMGLYGAGLLAEKLTFEANQFTLDCFLVQRNVPTGFDLLVIDVEGAEARVLAGFTLSDWKPKLVIIERPPVPNCFTEAGYEQVYADWINTIYKRKD